MIKPKIHEISKQFGVPNKEILEVLAKYKVTGKSYMSSLEPNEMDIILEYYTQKRDKGENLEAILRAAVNAETEKKEAAEKAANKPAQNSPKDAQKNPQKNGKKPADKNAQPQQNAPQRSKKEVRYVDTRTNAVDLEQQLKTEKAATLVNVDIKDSVVNKQKIKKNRNKPTGQQSSRKTRANHATACEMATPK